MNESKLQEIQDEIMRDLDNESKIETHIKDSSDSIASQLLLSKKVTTEINGTPYFFAYRMIEKGEKKFIYVLVANVIKRQITPEKYIPFSATAEVEEEYSMKDNLKAVVEAFIRHVTGKIKPEILAD